MPQQPKPPDLDEQGNPIDTQPPDLDEFYNPISQEPSFGSKVWRAISQTPEFIAEPIRRGVEQFTAPRESEIPTGEPGLWNNYLDAARKFNAMQRGFVGGAVQGASTFLNPIDTLGMAFGVGEYNAARRGASTLAKALKWGERGVAAPLVAHGIERISDPTSSLGEKGAGLAELAGGSLGAAFPPTPVRPRPGASALSSGPASALPEPSRQAPLPFEPPEPARIPQPEVGQQVLPYGYGEPEIPIKPPINQVVAESITKPPVPEEAFLDVAGPGGMDAKLTSIEGIQAAFREGKVDRETALRLMQKVHRKLLVKPEAEVPAQKTSTITEDEMEVIIDADTGEIISDKPYPLTTEPASGVTPPAGVDEVVRMVSNGEVRNVADLQKKLGVSFNKTKTLWYEAKEIIKNQKTPDTTAQIPLMITKQMEVDLKTKGYTTEQINAMKPQEAWDVLNTKEIPKSESTIKVPRGQADKTYIQSLRKDGYEFQGLDDEGNYTFGRAESSSIEAPGFTSKFKGATDEALSQEANLRIDKMEDQPHITEYPEAARVKGGKVKIGADIPTLGKELGRSLYKGNINTIATKELIQNSLDAIGPAQGKLGPNGEVHVSFDGEDKTLTVSDNGKGMTRREVETVFTDLGRSGKRDLDEAMGGFGLAKAAPLLGGEYVNLETVAFDKRRGATFKISFEGSPDDILKGVDLNEELVPMGTPTGTTVKVRTEDGWFNEAEDFVKTVARHSAIQGKIFMKGRFDSQATELTGILAGVKASVPDKIVTTLSNPSANVTLSIPGDASYGKTSRIRVHLKNKGMYQSTIDVHLGQAMPDVPNEVVANIDAIVPEDHADYPFTANRENLRGKTEQQVTKYVQDEIVAPAAKKYSDGVQELYDNMEVIKTKSGRNIAFYDTGGKYTKLEFFQVINTPIIKRLAEQVDTILQQALSSVNKPAWTSKLERVGIIFDESLRGIHIPNPASSGKRSTILVNPLQLMSTRTPDEFAAGLIHTTLHEMAHLEPGWVGHGDDFCIRLGDIYEKFGASRANYHQQTVRAYVTGGSGDYTPEIQKILQGYTDSRGRSATTDDVLTRTGTQQRFGPGGTGEFSPGGKSDGKGTLRNIPVGRSIIVNPKNASPEVIKKLWQEGFRFDGENATGGLRFTKKSEPSAGPILEEEVGGQRPTKRAIQGQLGPIQDAQKSSIVAEVFNLPRGIMASWDLSAPLRQGLPMIHKKEFWTALEPMGKSWASEEGFRASQDSIANRPLFKKRYDAVGKELPSFADDAGLKLTDLVDLSKREEAIMSTWAEVVPGVRRSNRAYTAFLNNLRADTFESLIKDAGIFMGDAKAIERNLPMARAIADFVNTATGRGKLSIDIPKSMQPLFGTDVKGRPRTELSLESSAVLLNTGLFAPRLIASRIKMLNPMTYMMAPPQVRKEYIKSLFALTGFGMTILQLARMAGAEVSLDPNSSDFGKAKIGDKVRLDPWGGFQQYIVLASRLMSGKVSSSTSNKQYDLWNPKPGPYDPSHTDILARFARGKTNPVINFAWALLDHQKEMSGKPMQFSTPNPFENSITQRFIPIFVQDVYQIAQEDPKLLPILAPAAGLGMGVQVYDNPR